MFVCFVYKNMLQKFKTNFKSNMAPNMAAWFLNTISFHQS